MNVPRGLVAIALALAVVASAAAGDKSSGPKKGAQAELFEVHDYTGRFKGEKVCYV